jgi:hypothetical protein
VDLVGWRFTCGSGRASPANLLRWVPDDRCSRCDVLGHDGTGPDGSTATDSDTRQNSHSCGDERVFLDPDRTVFRVFVPEVRAVTRDRMVTGDESAFGAHGHV